MFLKVVKMLNFMLCLFYHNLRVRGERERVSAKEKEREEENGNGRLYLHGSQLSSKDKH